MLQEHRHRSFLWHSATGRPKAKGGVGDRQREKWWEKPAPTLNERYW